ncbi:hypothetical protein EC968_000640, partial [Mortierella alpina]
MHFAEKGSLAANISRIGDLNEDIAREISSGLVYLHGLGYVHKKINTSNILLTEDFEAKIAGFGSESGAVRLAPELADALRPFSTRTDIFDLGMVLKEMGGGSDEYMSWMKMCCSPNPEERPLTCPLKPLEYTSMPTPRRLYLLNSGRNVRYAGNTHSPTTASLDTNCAISGSARSSTIRLPRQHFSANAPARLSTLDHFYGNCAVNGSARSPTIDTSSIPFGIYGNTRSSGTDRIGCDSMRAVHGSVCSLSNNLSEVDSLRAVYGSSRSSTIQPPRLNSAAYGQTRSSTVHNPRLNFAAHALPRSSPLETRGMNSTADHESHAPTTDTPVTEPKSLAELAMAKQDISSVRGWEWSDDNVSKIPVDVRNNEGYLLHAAETGEPLAQYNVGRHFYYKYKQSTREMLDLYRAEHWLLESAAQSFKPAWNGLGRLYYDQRRFKEAKEYFLKTAPNGDKEAQLYLAEAYYFGIDWTSDQASGSEDICQARG